MFVSLSPCEAERKHDARRPVSTSRTAVIRADRCAYRRATIARVTRASTACVRDPRTHADSQSKCRPRGFRMAPPCLSGTVLLIHEEFPDEERDVLIFPVRKCEKCESTSPLPRPPRTLIDPRPPICALLSATLLVQIGRGLQTDRTPEIDVRSSGIRSRYGFNSHDDALTIMV